MGYSQYHNDLWSLPTFPGVFLLFSFYFQIGLLLSFPEMSQDSNSLRAFCLWEPMVSMSPRCLSLLLRMLHLCLRHSLLSEALQAHPQPHAITLDFSLHTIHIILRFGSKIMTVTRLYNLNN